MDARTKPRIWVEHEEDDLAQTRVYFEPPTGVVASAAPRLLSAPAAARAAPEEQPYARRKPIAASQPPPFRHRPATATTDAVPVILDDPPRPAPRLPTASQPPPHGSLVTVRPLPPLPRPALAALASSGYLLPSTEPTRRLDRHSFRPSFARQGSRRSPRAIGVVVGALCVVAGVWIGATSSHHVDAATAAGQVVPAPATIKMQPVIVPIDPAPAPSPAPAPVPAPVSAPALVPAPVPASASAGAPTPHVHHHHRPTVAAARPHLADPFTAGTLAISTKPPCNIAIDGAPTGLTTPQRQIELAPGAHRVTLTNSDAGIARTAEVVIVADRATRVIRDFTR